MDEDPGDAIADALDLLKQLTLVKSTPGCLSVHPLVQKAWLHPKVSSDAGRPRLELLEMDALQRLVGVVCKLLDYRFPRADVGGQSHWGKWETCARYMAHVESAKRHYEEFNKRPRPRNAAVNKIPVPPELTKLVQNSSWYQYELGDYDKCLELAHFGQKLSVEGSDEYAHFSSNAACAHFELHEVRKGQAEIDAALAIREPTLGPNDSQLANAFNNKGILLCSAGEYQRALEFHNRCFKIRRVTKDNYLGGCHFHRGIVNMLLGNLATAEKELVTCGDICRQGGRAMDFLLS